MLPVSLHPFSNTLIPQITPPKDMSTNSAEKMVDKSTGKGEEENKDENFQNGKNKRNRLKIFEEMTNEERKSRGSIQCLNSNSSSQSLHKKNTSWSSDGSKNLKLSERLFYFCSSSPEHPLSREGVITTKFNYQSFEPLYPSQFVKNAFSTSIQNPEENENKKLNLLISEMMKKEKRVDISTLSPEGLLSREEENSHNAYSADVKTSYFSPFSGIMKKKEFNSEASLPNFQCRELNVENRNSEKQGQRLVNKQNRIYQMENTENKLSGIITPFISKLNPTGQFCSSGFIPHAHDNTQTHIQASQGYAPSNRPLTITVNQSHNTHPHTAKTQNLSRISNNQYSRDFFQFVKRNLLVCNLNCNISIVNITDLFAKFGPIKSIDTQFFQQK
jgi:hypothetical protein